MEVYLKQWMSDYRYTHTQSVRRMCKVLGEGHGANIEILDQAALLHDCIKEKVPADFVNLGIELTSEDQDIWNVYPAIWHAALAGKWIRHHFEELDERVDGIVSAHTTGRAAMSLEEQVLFVADAVEEGRTYSYRDMLAKWALDRLDLVTAILASKLILRLVEKGQTIHPDTVLCYNHYRLLCENHWLLPEVRQIFEASD